MKSSVADGTTGDTQLNHRQLMKFSEALGIKRSGERKQYRKKSIYRSRVMFELIMIILIVGVLMFTFVISGMIALRDNQKELKRMFKQLENEIKIQKTKR